MCFRCAKVFSIDNAESSAPSVGRNGALPSGSPPLLAGGQGSQSQGVAKASEMKTYSNLLALLQSEDDPAEVRQLSCSRSLTWSDWFDACTIISAAASAAGMLFNRLRICQQVACNAGRPGSHSCQAAPAGFAGKRQAGAGHLAGSQPGEIQRGRQPSE